MIGARLSRRSLCTRGMISPDALFGFRSFRISPLVDLLMCFIIGVLYFGDRGILYYLLWLSCIAICIAELFHFLGLTLTGMGGLGHKPFPFFQPTYHFLRYLEYRMNLVLSFLVERIIFWLWMSFYVLGHDFFVFLEEDMPLDALGNPWERLLTGNCLCGNMRVDTLLQWAFKSVHYVLTYLECHDSKRVILKSSISFLSKSQSRDFRKYVWSCN